MCGKSEIESLITEFEGLLWGIGFKQIDRNAAQRKMEEARGLGSRYAEAWCLFEGWNCEKDEEGAAALFYGLAEEGDEREQAMLGYCIYWGRGVAQDYADAVSWLQKSNHAHAQCFLGECYCNGQGVTQDYIEAAKCYHKAAEQGHADAQCRLGQCYHEGHGVPQDYTHALKWYRMAHWSNPSYVYELIHCLRDAAHALLDTGDRIESAELLWEAIKAKHARGGYSLKDTPRAFWTKTLPPLRLIAARAVFLAGESAGLDIYHEGIRDEAELVGVSLKAAGLPYGPK